METGTTLLLDATGDLVIDRLRQIPTTAGTDKARQDLTVILRSAIGSLATDPQFGTDIVGMVRAGNTDLIAGIIRTAIQQYQYTQSIDSIDIGPPTPGRRATITARVTLSDSSAVALEVVV